MIIGSATDEAFVLGVLSSNLHTQWVLETGGWLGIGNDSRYAKSRVFDPFPYPDPNIPVRDRIRALAEELDATRRAALDDSPSLILTGLYIFVAAIRDGTLPPEQEAAAVRARAPSSLPSCTTISISPSPMPMAGATTGGARRCRLPKSSAASSRSTPRGRPKKRRAMSAGCAPITRSRASAADPASPRRHHPRHHRFLARRIGRPPLRRVVGHGCRIKRHPLAGRRIDP